MLLKFSSLVGIGLITTFMVNIATILYYHDVHEFLRISSDDIILSIDNEFSLNLAQEENLEIQTKSDAELTNDIIIDKMPSMNEITSMYGSNVDHSSLPRDKEEILEILTKSGVELTNDIIARMPSMHDITSMYGSNVDVIGLDTCQTFKMNVLPMDRMVGSVGTYNTGTNLMFHLLNKYCVIKERADAYDESRRMNISTVDDNKTPGVRTGFFGDVPWGKHSPHDWRDNDRYRLKAARINNVVPKVKVQNILPLVMIKDPYSWSASMCRHRYGASWVSKTDSCLNLDAKYDRNDSDEDHEERKRRSGKKMKRKYGHEFRDKIRKERKRNRSGLKIEYILQNRREYLRYENVIDLWNKFYSGYVNATFPRIIVRYEDVLLHVDKIIPQICECVGGTLITEKNEIVLGKDSAKSKKVYGKSSNLAESLERYGSSQLRIAHMSRGDMVEAEHSISRELMKMFHYTFPKLED